MTFVVCVDTPYVRQSNVNCRFAVMFSSLDDSGSD